MELADRNNWSLSEAKRKITSSELLLWKAYFEHDLNSFHREDYLAARICQEIKRTSVKNPRKVKLDEFLVKFEVKNKQDDKPPTPEQLKIRNQRSKMFWMAIVGAPQKPPKE